MGALALQFFARNIKTLCNRNDKNNTLRNILATHIYVHMYSSYLQVTHSTWREMHTPTLHFRYKLSAAVTNLPKLTSFIFCYCLLTPTLNQSFFQQVCHHPLTELSTPTTSHRHIHIQYGARRSFFFLSWHICVVMQSVVRWHSKEHRNDEWFPHPP